MRNFLIIALPIVMFANASVAEAQDPRQQRRRAFVEDLLKGLIESQLEPNNAREPARPNIRPAQPIQATPKMVQVRQQLRALSEQSEHLIYDLRQEEAYTPTIRPLLGDALQIKANIDVLYRRSLKLPTVEPILEGYRIVDRDWRLLNHRLNQIQGLSKQCIKCYNQFNEFENKLCGLLEIQPQIDRRELSRLAGILTNDFDHLLQDIYFDCRTDPNLPDLMQRGQRLQAQIRQAGGLIRSADYDVIVNAYQTCMKGWREFSRRLRRFDSDRISRDVQRIEATGLQIHEMLWLPSQLDREYIGHTIASIQKDAGKLFKDLTLEDLLKCKHPSAVVASAREFQQQCGIFAQGVSSGQSLDDLLWDFRLFEVQWEEFHGHIHDLETRRAARRVEEIENSFSVLKETFGAGPEINRFTMSQIASSLDQWTSQLSHRIHKVVDERTYGRDFHRNMCALGDSLNRSVQNVHRMSTNNQFGPAFQNELNESFKYWNQMKPMMVKCQPNHRKALAQFRSKIEPLMVKLQVVYTE